MFEPIFIFSLSPPTLRSCFLLQEDADPHCSQLMRGWFPGADDKLQTFLYFTAIRAMFSTVKQQAKILVNIYHIYSMVP